MTAFYRFYSVVGRISIARFAGVVVITVVVLFAVSHVDWQWGLAANILAGAIGGAAFAKLLVDAIRRLGDAGISRRIAAWVALAFGAATGAALYAVLTSDPPWAAFVLTAVEYGAPITCAAALLWPPRRDASDSARARARAPDRAGVAIAAMCVVGGAAGMGFVAWLSIGMDASNRRNAAFEAGRDRGGQLP